MSISSIHSAAYVNQTAPSNNSQGLDPKTQACEYLYELVQLLDQLAADIKKGDKKDIASLVSQIKDLTAKLKAIADKVPEFKSAILTAAAYTDDVVWNPNPVEDLVEKAAGMDTMLEQIMIHSS